MILMCSFIARDHYGLKIDCGILSVSGNWRLTFAFDGEDGVDVDLEDYL